MTSHSLSYVVRQGPSARVAHAQIVRLHHDLVDVHQLLQLQLLARVDQLAQLPTLLQIRLQLDQTLQHLLVRLVLLAETVVLVLHVTIPAGIHLPSRTKHQVWVRVVHVGEGPVATQQRLPQLLSLALPVVENVLAHLVRVHATELQLLQKEGLQNVLCESGRLLLPPSARSCAPLRTCPRSPACARKGPQRASWTPERCLRRACASAATSARHAGTQNPPRHGSRDCTPPCSSPPPQSAGYT